VTNRVYIVFASCLYEVLLTDSRIDHIRQTLSDGHTTTRLRFSQLPQEVKLKVLRKIKKTNGKATTKLG
jgi:hypothetical protein